MSDYTTPRNTPGVPFKGATGVAPANGNDDVPRTRIAPPEGSDDGSLAFLRIPRDPSNKSWPDNVVKQSRLVNTTFWVCDYQTVSTRFTREKGTDGQALVLIKDNPEQPDTEARKFFTGSKDIKYILDKIRELNAFPRRVTLRGSGNRYWIE